MASIKIHWSEGGRKNRKEEKKTWLPERWLHKVHSPDTVGEKQQPCLHGTLHAMSDWKMQ